MGPHRGDHGPITFPPSEQGLSGTAETLLPMHREGAETAIPWRSRAFQTVLVSTLMLPLGVPLVSPFLPLIRDAFELTDTHASLLLSVYFLPGVVLSPGIGLVIDRVGRRPALVFSLVTFGGVGTGIVFLGDFRLILAARLVQGIAAAGVFVTTVTIIADSFAGVQRNAVFGLNVAVLSAGRAVYPLVGGALARVGWATPFVCYLAAVLAGVVAFRRFEESPRSRRPHAGVSVRRTIVELAARRRLGLYVVTVLAELVTFGGVMTTLPFFLTAVHGVSVITVGAFLTVTTVASALTAAENGLLARWLPTPVLIAAGLALLGLGLLGIGLAPAPVAMVLPVILFGTGIGLVLPSVDAAISQAITREFHAVALSLRNSATGVGRASGPLLFTAAATVVGYRGLLVGAGLMTLVAGLGGLAMARD